MQDRVRDWLFRQALPLWADAGIDAEGRFFEKLDFDGRPITGRPRRTRVQARQVYVFAEAVSLGWGQGETVARRALDILIRDYRRDDGLWVRSVDDAGAVLSQTLGYGLANALGRAGDDGDLAAQIKQFHA